MEHAVNWGGRLYIKQGFFAWLTKAVTTIVKFSKINLEGMASWERRVYFVNSFWGLEKAQAIAPNIILTGPLHRHPSDMLALLEKKNKDLFDWMNSALEKNIPIVYITLGSECRW